MLHPGIPLNLCPMNEGPKLSLAVLAEVLEASEENYMVYCHLLLKLHVHDKQHHAHIFTCFYKHLLVDTIVMVARFV